MSTVYLRATSSEYRNEKQFIARITGRDPKFTFARQFIGKKDGQTTEESVDDPGLYELGIIGKKGDTTPGFRLLLEVEGQLREMKLQSSYAPGDRSADDLAMEIAKRIGNGEELSDFVVATVTEGEIKYHLRSKAEARKEANAATLDSITEQCWDRLKLMPEKEAKAALKTLAKRLAQPKALGTDSSADLNGAANA